MLLLIIGEVVLLSLRLSRLILSLIRTADIQQVVHKSIIALASLLFWM